MAGVPARVSGLFADAQREELLALRRHLHANPELAFHERATAARLRAALERVPGLEIRAVADTGLLARIPGRRRSAPVVAVRGDIDALPIQEATGLAYASTNAGVMHACGHDVHAPWAVGAAQLLAAEPTAGDVLIVLQPAEEIGQGALAVLDSGALDGVRCIFGGHVDRRFDVGQVVADAGALAASTDRFTITVQGQGAHAARPHEAADPIVGAAALVSALQTIVSRRLNPAVPGVVTVGTIHAGTASNVIPDAAELTGTVRAVDGASRAFMLQEVRKVAASCAAAYGLVATVAIEAGTPPLVNSERGAAWARAAAADVMGRTNVVPLGLTNLGGEDFAYYLERMDGCFLRIGAREPGGEAIPAHSARFVPDEAAVFIGAAVLAACARRASADLGGAVERAGTTG